MIRRRALFPVAALMLWVGSARAQTNALVVPNQAVQTGQEGPFVFVVKPDRSVESRPVATGARMDQDMVIERGLRPGETVVTEGQLRLAPGIKVTIRSGRGTPPRTKTRG